MMSILRVLAFAFGLIAPLAHGQFATSLISGGSLEEAPTGNLGSGNMEVADPDEGIESIPPA